MCFRVAAVLALALAAVGTDVVHDHHAQPRSRGQAPRPPITCRTNGLLHPVCPRRAAGARGEGFTCSIGGRRIVAAFRTDRWPVVAWSFELPRGLYVSVAASRRGRVTDVTGVAVHDWRTGTVSLGPRHWGSKRGRLVLVPHRLVAQGAPGDELVFYIPPRFTGDTSYSLGVKGSRRPLARLVATLRALVAS